MKATQYMVLEEVARLQPISLGALARQMIMERATIGKNIRPLESSGYVRVVAGEDRRSREVLLTDEGRRVLELAKYKWQKAQEIFESEVGEKESDVLRQMLSEVASIDFLSA
ncbi:MarR family winged helix-turn-helix transcriptional regulator [Duganella aquatilis]|uniref:MarR family winged helix-turn-helix transcriptional regulator n=1 Tax=Duganella aquatilis TaxID=2666082 RepID=UPI00140B6157|nr:MarR family transcriptional regulator [Duganella aquatilis]